MKDRANGKAKKRKCRPDRVHTLGPWTLNPDASSSFYRGILIKEIGEGAFGDLEEIVRLRDATADDAAAMAEVIQEFQQARDEGASEATREWPVPGPDVFFGTVVRITFRCAEGYHLRFTAHGCGPEAGRLHWGNPSHAD